MLTARLGIRYPDDWTEEIGHLGVSGDIYTATLHKREYMGLIRLQETLDEALAFIRTVPYHESVEVVQHDRHGNGVSVDDEQAITAFHLDGPATITVEENL